MGEAVARALLAAEERLRADGLTGGRAFEALLAALRRRLGEDVDAPASAVGALASLPVGADVDLLGLAYERFFADLFKGRRGQFFTPRPLVELLLSRLDLDGKTVLDPTCGSGGFLVCAARRGARVRGIEKDPLLAELAALNLRLARQGGEVVAADFFAADPEPVDVVVANPPFSVPITEPHVLARYGLSRRVLSDALFVSALGRWVRPGGRAGIVLPWSVVANATGAALREQLAADFAVDAICALPEGVFRPFGGAAGRAGLLWLTRRAPDLQLSLLQRPTEWAELRDPGWDVSLQRFRATSDAEIQALGAGSGWSALPPGSWVPRAEGLSVRAVPLARVAAPSDGRQARSPGEAAIIDLADADRETGEVRARVCEVTGPRTLLSEGEILVARLRPELGNVAIARKPAGYRGVLVGSPEWIPLRAHRWPHFTLLALRTPAWRAQLAVTEGQTRPRTTVETVSATEVPFPGEALARRIDVAAAGLHAARSALRDRLDRLQRAMDAWAAGELSDAELEAEIAAVERG